MKNNNNMPAFGYLKKLRSQAPYYQASNSEILEDLELLNCSIDRNTHENNLTADISLNFPKKRTRNIRKFEVSDEDEAVEGLASLMAKIKSMPKQAKSPQNLPQKQQENIQPQPLIQNYASFRNFNFQSLPYAFPQAFGWRNYMYPYPYPKQFQTQFISQPAQTRSSLNLNRRSMMHLAIAHMIAQNQQKVRNEGIAVN
ncbi:unnamed protein product [Blepharisma stoltei]|uniref:Uncharacterized protein n=1 Tax=Blepharisma stoltei TaxID=1481888 RepID=A0AAU9J2Y4_9CILI|nr:unnamed protein product [Blepharisma stoltei]